MPERIYLDSCVLNRPTDDQTQERIRSEVAAIARVLDEVAAGNAEWIASDALAFELGRNPHLQRRQDSLDLLAFASETYESAASTYLRMDQLCAEGYGVFDALHLAIAEEAGVASLLTVDDRFLRRAATRPAEARPMVENPLDWLRRRQPWLIKR
jgi:predicted nucleic acid-binding protein